MTVIRPLPQLVTSLRACVHPASVSVSALYVICFVRGAADDLSMVGVTVGLHTPLWQELNGEKIFWRWESGHSWTNALSGTDGARDGLSVTWSGLHHAAVSRDSRDTWPDLKFIDSLDSGWTCLDIDVQRCIFLGKIQKYNTNFEKKYYKVNSTQKWIDKKGYVQSEVFSF